ncbi:MAG: hypothetical protein NWE95_01725 [Candidatus Bathyarchaeota archaeon]|nr:hypothetical protein [Candidatus Bathyarchaeota archaeon]
MSVQMDELIVIMKEILKWTKFAGAKEVRNVLTITLDTEQKRLVYHLSDGNNGTRKIAEIADVCDKTVRNYWESWYRQGIVDPINVKGGQRFKKSFALEDFGIAVPPTQIEAKRREE